MRTLQRSLLLSVFTLLLVLPRNIFSCGPFFEQATFSYDSHPDFPVSDYIGGKLGILKPSFHRMFLVVAYRNLVNRPFTPSERAALDPILTAEAHYADALDSYGMSYDAGDPNQTPPPSPSQVWLSERARALGEKVSQDASIDPDKPYGEYQTFLNCPDPAFLNAVQTLKDREQRWGANSADLKAWIAGQDDVFSNCSSKEFKEPAPVTTSNKLLKQDRDYQIAAALFYSGDPSRLLVAVKQYESIAQDKSSPWHVWAPYLAARALIRTATLKPSETGKFDPEILKGAEIALKKVHAYKEYAPTYAACDKMLGFVEARLHPEDFAHQLGTQLANGTSTNLAQDLIDYRYLLDSGLGIQPDSRARKDDLTDWVISFQVGSTAKDHAIAKWRETKSLPWLVAALNAIDASDPAAKDLLAATAAVNARDPRLLTVLYDRVVLLRALKNDKDARSLVDANLAYLAKDAPVSARNLFWGQRMALAETLDDFLHFAPREDAAEHHTQAHIDETKPAPPGTPIDVYFDTDAIAVLNHALPLSRLEETAASAQIPKPLQDEVASAAFTRALLLNKPEVAANFAPAVRKATPVLAPYIDDYAKASTDDARHRAALWTLLHNPGMKPFVVPNMQRTSEMNKIDDYRDNWWCEDVGAKLDKTTWKTVMGDEPGQKAVPPPNPQFLNSADKSAGMSEWTPLSKIGSAPNYMAAEVIAWAKTAPDDPRVPEALHLVVRSTRYGCVDDKSKGFSKQAFQLLHSKYPKSEWTKKTPYFY
jgi:hypothetical protein